jgi:hypothetical protein
MREVSRVIVRGKHMCSQLQNPETFEADCLRFILWKLLAALLPETQHVRRCMSGDPHSAERATEAQRHPRPAPCHHETSPLVWASWISRRRRRSQAVVTQKRRIPNCAKQIICQFTWRCLLLPLLLWTQHVHRFICGIVRHAEGAIEA